MKVINKSSNKTEITKECFRHFYGELLSLQFTEKTNPRSKNSFAMESARKRYRCCLVSMRFHRYAVYFPKRSITQKCWEMGIKFFSFFYIYILKIKVPTHNKGERKILTHGQIRTLNQTIQNNRYQTRTPQGTMWYSPGPTKNKDKLNKHKHYQEATWL